MMGEKQLARGGVRFVAMKGLGEPSIVGLGKCLFESRLTPSEESPELLAVPGGNLDEPVDDERRKLREPVGQRAFGSS